MNQIRLLEFHLMCSSFFHAPFKIAHVWIENSVAFPIKLCPFFLNFIGICFLTLLYFHSWASCYGLNDFVILLQIGFLYLRYLGDFKTLWGWYEPYLKDDEVKMECSTSTRSFYCVFWIQMMHWCILLGFWHFAYKRHICQFWSFPRYRFVCKFDYFHQFRGI